MTHWERYALQHLALLENQFGADSEVFLKTAERLLEAFSLEGCYAC